MFPRFPPRPSFERTHLLPASPTGAERSPVKRRPRSASSGRSPRAPPSFEHTSMLTSTSEGTSSSLPTLSPPISDTRVVLFRPPGEECRMLLPPPAPRSTSRRSALFGQLTTYAAIAGFSCFLTLALLLLTERARNPEKASTAAHPQDDTLELFLAGSRSLDKFGVTTAATGSARNRSGRNNAQVRRVSSYMNAPNTRDTSSKVQWNDDVCWTEPCISEGSSLRSAVEPTLNPCDDFYAYVCDRWSHGRPLPRGHAEVSVDLDLLNVFTLDAFNALSKPSVDPLYEKLRLLLSSCVLWPEESFKPLAEFALRSVGLVNWPYDHDADADAVSVSTTLGRLINYFDLDPLFGIAEVADPASVAGVRTLYAFMGPDPILDEGLEPGKHYTFIHHAYKILVEALDAKSLYDPFETEAQLATIAAETSSISETAVKLKNCSRSLVEDLPSLGNWLFWDKLFLEVFTGQRLGPNGSEVLVPDSNFFAKLNQTSLLNVTSSKFKMANYLGFRLLLLLSPFGGSIDDFNDPASLAYATHRGYPTSLHEYQACMRFLDKTEPVVAMRRLHQEWDTKIGKMSEVVKLVNYLRSELTICLKTSSNFLTTYTAIAARIMLQFLEGLSWQVLEPDVVEHSWIFEKLAAVYDRLNASQPIDVLGFIRSAIQLKRDGRSDISASHWQGGFLGAFPQLAHPFKVLEVPLPVFSLYKGAHESVRHLQIPRVAPRVYAAIYRALYYVGNNLVVDNVTWNPIRFFESTADCLRDQYASLPQKDNIARETNSARTGSLADLFEALALGSAWDAYAVYAVDKHKTYSFKGSGDFNWKQVFFIEYARGLCENRDPNYHARKGPFGVGAEVRSAAWFRVNGPLMNVREFAHAFSCPPRSLMNPGDRCPLIRKHH
ncbi:hypothetical protein ISCGN_003942 [Ixodes scapularis]